MANYTSFRLYNGRMASSLNNLPVVPLNAGAGGDCRDPDAGTCGLIGLTVKESIFSPTVMGEGYIRDYDGSFISSLGSYIGIGGYDLLLLDYEQQGDGIATVRKTLQFMVYAYSQISNEVESLSKSQSVPRIIVLKLASPEFALLNYLFFEYFETDEDMILPISKQADDEEQTGDCEPYQGEGLVQYLVGKMNTLAKYPQYSPLNAEPTKNWIWLKRNYSMYPWGKMVSPPRIMQLMQMLADNAVHKDNEFAANFFFWRGLDAWNFYSLETLVQRQPVKTYKLSSNVSCMNNVGVLVSDGVDEFLISSHDETDYFDLMKSHAFGSNYLSVNPNYENPYYRYLDAAGAHKIKVVEYDYFTQGGLWKKLPNDEFSDYIGAVVSCNDGLITRNAKNNRVVDNNYGYFSPGFFNNDKHVSWEYYGYTFASRQEKTLWQTQFDITPIEGEELYNVMKKVKQPLQKARERYAELKNLKEAWKVYKCSVCCAGDIDSGIPVTTGFTYSGGITLSPVFVNPKAEKSFNLRKNVSVGRLSDYEVVAAGSFTDAINFDSTKIGVGVTGLSGGEVITLPLNPWHISGMSLSYNLNAYPYNLTIGEFLNLEKDPDNFILYRFDLEIKRHEKLKTILENNIQARIKRVQNYNSALKGYTAAYLLRNEVCLTLGEDGCTGYCLCPTEYPEVVEKRVELINLAHGGFTGAEKEIMDTIDDNITVLQELKEEFISLYDKFWSRKAFFFSKDIDLSFLQSTNNLVNVKSIKRIPIIGSKYESFALRQVIPGVSGISFSSGSSYDYPYHYTPWDPANAIPGSNSSYSYGTLLQEAIDKKGPSGNRIPGRYGGYGISGATSGYDFWESFDTPYGNFPYSEFNDEITKGPIWYRNWLVKYNIVLIKPPCLNRKPACSDDDCTCDEITIPLKMHFESFSNGETSGYLTDSKYISDHALVQLSKNCDGCRISILDVKPVSDIKLYHPWAADELGVTFSYENYKKASSLFGLTGFSGSEIVSSSSKAPKAILADIESYVRIEFKTPIGLNTLSKLPDGFVDSCGSEYFLPYIVLLTAGPFGSQAARTNISVIGMDPYGFDVAVKKIKNKDDFGGMNLAFTDGNDKFSALDSSKAIDLKNPYKTSSSWLKTYQNALFYKPKDGIADLFVPNGIQDIFMASSLERSMPVKTWWDLWISLPPIAVATFYNRWDVLGASGGSLVIPTSGQQGQSGITNTVGIAFYHNNSIVAEPFAWTGGICGCSGGCTSDPPWPLFLQPDTEQFISGCFPYDVAVRPLKNNDAIKDEERTEDGYYLKINPKGQSGGACGPTLGQFVSMNVLSDDPSNYVYGFSEFPHIIGTTGITGIEDKIYPQISYPIGTLIWGSKFDSGYTLTETLPDGTITQKRIADHNLIHYWDFSRKTQYGLVSLSSDSIPSVLSLIGGFGGEIDKVQAYHKWISDKLIDWFQNSIFDNNFAGQFVVMSKFGNNDGCLNYPCMNPDGFPGFSGCTSGDPLCNCPCIDLRPDLLAQGITLISGLSGNKGKEPSSLELEYLERVTSECNKIELEPCLGKDWLGCVWDDPYSPLNCNCPCFGKKFPTYLAINRTNATFWGTPLETPLLRTAQMALFNSNKIEIQVYGDISVKSGDVIFLNAAAEAPEGYSRFHGYWLASSVNHEFSPYTHKMKLTLSRELPNPCQSPSPTPTP